MGVLMPITNNLICANTIPTAVICCIIAGIVIALVFVVAFFLELMTPVRNSSRRVDDEQTDNFDINEMLLKLEQSAQKAEEEQKEEKFNQTKILAPVEELKSAEEPIIEPEPVVEAVEEPVNEEPAFKSDYDFDALFAKIENELNATQNADVEPEQEKEPIAEPVEEKVQEVSETTTVVEETTIIEEPKIVGPEFDYNVRLETINNSLVKLEKDLAKATKEVNKYEKTEKRKARSEKLLDRKASELTNLNLVLYNVNDIKDIDPEKKQKQESLVEHIAELKATISEADEYIAKNKEKYENSKKIKTFLEGEKTRYNEEITELNMLIAQAKKNK